MMGLVENVSEIDKVTNLKHNAAFLCKFTIPRVLSTQKVVLFYTDALHNDTLFIPVVLAPKSNCLALAMF